jgi:hypothetical protein
VELRDLYNSSSINSTELGYYIVSLVQYEEFVKDTQTFTEIIQNASKLELPESQVEEKCINRQEVLDKVLDLIDVFPF